MATAYVTNTCAVFTYLVPDDQSTGDPHTTIAEHVDPTAPPPKIRWVDDNAIFRHTEACGPQPYLAEHDGLTTIPPTAGSWVAINDIFPDFKCGIVSRNHAILEEHGDTSRRQNDFDPFVIDLTGDSTLRGRSSSLDHRAKQKLLRKHRKLKKRESVKIKQQLSHGLGTIQGEISIAKLKSLQKRSRKRLLKLSKSAKKAASKAALGKVLAREFALSIWKKATNQPKKLVYWVDGSYARGGLGGAAIVLDRGRVPLNFEAYAMKGATSSFDAELYAIEAALDNAVLETEDNPVPRIVIFSDCTPAIKFANSGSIAVDSLGEKGMCDMDLRTTRSVDSISNLISRLSARGCTVEMHWVPGHKGVPGNVYADGLAGLARRMSAEMKLQDGEHVQVRQVAVELMELAVLGTSPKLVTVGDVAKVLQPTPRAARASEHESDRPENGMSEDGVGPNGDVRPLSWRHDDSVDHCDLGDCTRTLQRDIILQDTTALEDAITPSTGRARGPGALQEARPTNAVLTDELPILV